MTATSSAACVLLTVRVACGFAAAATPTTRQAEAAAWFDRAEKDIVDAGREVGPPLFSLAFELNQIAPTESRRILAIQQIRWAVGGGSSSDHRREQSATMAVYHALLGDSEGARSFLKKYDGIKTDHPTSGPVDPTDPAAPIRAEALIVLGDRIGFDEPMLTPGYLSEVVNRLLAHGRKEDALFVARLEHDRVMSEPPDGNTYHRLTDRRTAAVDLTRCGELGSPWDVEKGLGADEIYPNQRGKMMAEVAVVNELLEGNYQDAIVERSRMSCLKLSMAAMEEVRQRFPGEPFFDPIARSRSPESWEDDFFDYAALLARFDSRRMIVKLTPEIMATMGYIPPEDPHPDGHSAFNYAAADLRKRVDRLLVTGEWREAPLRSRLAMLYAVVGETGQFRESIERAEACIAAGGRFDREADYLQAAAARARAGDAAGAERDIAAAKEAGGLLGDELTKRMAAIFFAYADAGLFDNAIALRPEIRDDGGYQLTSYLTRRFAEAGRFDDAWGQIESAEGDARSETVYELARIQTKAGKADDLDARIAKTKSAYDRAVIELAAGTALADPRRGGSLFPRRRD